jgi:integrase/recombinase XerD
LQWRNPINKVKPPRVDIEPLEPVPMEVIKAMLATCGNNFTGRRDRSIILFLLDTGVRAGELLALDRQDVDPLQGDVLIRKSKSRKPRTVFIGRTARKALRVYLKIREDAARALFVSDEGERLQKDGLRQIMVRRSKRAQVQTPSLHSFRRAFALAMLRTGVDLLTISRLLGHSDLSLLNRYIRQNADDLRNTPSPVDGLL